LSSILVFRKDCGKQVPNERQAADVLRRELEVGRGQRYTIRGV